MSRSVYLTNVLQDILYCTGLWKVWLTATHTGRSIEGYTIGRRKPLLNQVLWTTCIFCKTKTAKRKKFTDAFIQWNQRRIMRINLLWLVKMFTDMLHLSYEKAWSGAFYFNYPTNLKYCHYWTVSCKMIGHHCTCCVVYLNLNFYGIIFLYHMMKTGLFWCIVVRALISSFFVEAYTSFLIKKVKSVGNLYIDILSILW